MTTALQPEFPNDFSPFAAMAAGPEVDLPHDTVTLLIDPELSGNELIKAALSGKKVVCLTENTAGIVIEQSTERLGT